MAESRALRAGLHFAAGATLVALALTPMLLNWYPQPLFEAGGGSRAGVLTAVASAVFGPLAGYAFKRRIRWVVAVQSAMLVGGLFAVFLARPVYLVFAIDRFDLVPALDISARDLAEARGDEFRRRPIDGPHYVAAVLPQDERERQRLIDSALAGKDLQRFPKYYVPYHQEAANALKRAKPLATVYRRDPEAFDRFLQAAGRTHESVRVLPLRAKKRDGVVLLDAVSGAPLGVLLVEPW
jgi:hypothetical protein